MRRRAYLICLDWYLADDLVQETLTKIYSRWRWLARTGQPDAYARRVLVTSCIDARRRPWRREVSAFDPAGLAPDVDPSAQEAFSGVERDDPRAPLALALAALTPGQRATVVLRYYEDLSVEQTAALLGCSAGTVKSQTSKGWTSCDGCWVSRPFHVPREVRQRRRRTCDDRLGHQDAHYADRSGHRASR